MNDHLDGSTCLTGTCDPGECYEIRIKGHLDPRWSEWFDGLTITHLEAGETLLAGPVTDQSALHGLLIKIRDMNLRLIRVAKQ